MAHNRQKPAFGFYGFFGVFFVDVFLCFLNQGEHITHTENAAGHAVWIESLKVVELLAR